MKSRVKAGKVAILVMQAGLLAFGTGAFAATSFTDAERQQVDKVERVLFGKERPQLSFESRLRAIEVNLFGDSKVGSNQSRLASIDSVVGGSKNSYLLPPLAASFDPGIEVKEAPQVLASSPSDYLQASFLLEQAMSDYSRGNSEAAMKGFKNVLKQDPDNVDAYFNLGVIAESKGNKIEALRYYENASRLSPVDSELSTTVKALRSDLQAEERARIAEKQKAEVV
ncbi:MAG: tetratricopeptide repeat protein, partial [Candidatus Obscuribacterales bacterium]|nr:tetratricopeptide repeat protein [Candidatus Obscuribacterales bacterium]